MSLSELKNLFSLIQQAPENLRLYLETTFWVLVFLLLLWAILKILFNKQFKELYRIIGIAAKRAGEVGKIVAREAAKNLELPEPYPRLTKFFAIVFMINGYLAAFFFTCFALAVAAILILSDTPSFWARTGGMLFLVVLGYFAWFFFAQSEKDRIRLFKKNDHQDS
jgi:Ca2+/Na+ antiporter